MLQWTDNCSSLISERFAIGEYVEWVLDVGFILRVIPLLRAVKCVDRLGDSARIEWAFTYYKLSNAVKNLN